ncbi:hypothetical protein [Halegenticoccus tardaugens]|uniref:hypothetical protein n=1 Tax=Halegenticoccus tardaugens TaxID=2071624 RepID=UPI00100ACC7B|nr:hypothetical protein [Halegenticoccus tardaugens]
MRGPKIPKRWLIALVPAALLIALRGMVIEGGIPLDHERIDVVLTVLELVALLLPALAIALQVILQYSESVPIRSLGRGPELRRWAFVSAGGASACLFLAVFVLLGSVELPLTLLVGIALVWMAIYLFTLLPFAAALIAYRADPADERLHDTIGLYEPIAAYTTYPPEVREMIADHQTRLDGGKRSAGSLREAADRYVGDEGRASGR